MYEKWVPLTAVKMVHGDPKKVGSVSITTPVVLSYLSKLMAR